MCQSTPTPTVANPRFFTYTLLQTALKKVTTSRTAAEALYAFEAIREQAKSICLKMIQEGHSHVVLSQYHTLFEARAAVIGAVEARQEATLAPHKFPILCHIDQTKVASNRNHHPFLYQEPLKAVPSDALYATALTPSKGYNKRRLFQSLFATLQAVGADGFLMNSYEDALAKCEKILGMKNAVSSLPLAFLSPEDSLALTQEATVDKVLFLALPTWDSLFWKPAPNHRTTCILTHPQEIVTLSRRHRPVIVGQNINPSNFAKLHLAPEALPMMPVAIDTLVQEGIRQWESGACILNINLGPLTHSPEEHHRIAAEQEAMLLKHAQEPSYYHKAYLPLLDSHIRVMANLLYSLITEVPLPLSIDVRETQIVETLLKLYPGRLLLNSISEKPEEHHALLPLAKKYGAAIVVMPLAPEGPFPYRAEERCTLAKNIVLTALSYGLTNKDIILDPMVLPLQHAPLSALETLRTLDLFKQTFSSPTIIGLSNLTAGMATTEIAYSYQSQFLSMALSHGVHAIIMNPCIKEAKQSFLQACTLLGYPVTEPFPKETT